MDKYSVITISREYCAGGTSIAKGLSEKLGIPWYDRDFARITAEASGYSYEEVMDEGEQISSFASALNTFLNNSAAYISSFDEIFKAQKEELIKLSASPCIIIGRCGNRVFADEGINSYDIFLYADEETRIERFSQMHPGKTIDAKGLEKRDAKRENYYKKYTGHELGKYKDYNICLDTSAIGYEKSIEILANILKDRI